MLFRSLRNLILSGGQNVSDGWTRTLGATPGSLEFVQRHTEVVDLLARVHSYLVALPDNETERELYLQYVPQWYDAVVYRDTWGSSQRPPSVVVRPEILDHLKGLGANLTRRSRDPSLTEGKLAALTNSLEERRKLLEEADLESYLAQQIRTQVDHIEWLLSNVETFGVEPVARGARGLFGLAIPVIAKGGNWRNRVATALVGLVVFLGPIEDVTDKANNILTNLVETAQIIEHIGESDEPQKALPPGRSNDSGQGDPAVIEAPDGGSSAP